MVVFLAMLLAPVPEAKATVIKEFRIGHNKGYVRMVLEFDRPLTPPPSLAISHNTLQLALTGIIDNLTALRAGEYGNDIISLDAFKDSGTTRIDAVFSFAPADVKTFSLTGPHRFIIDTYRPRAPTAAELPVENEEPIALVVEDLASPGTFNQPGKQASPVAGGFSPAVGSADEFHRNRMQQRLLAALIVVTSIIVILLFFLIWMGRGRKEAREDDWKHHLPPTRDRTIESIDAVIRKHLDKHVQS